MRAHLFGAAALLSQCLLLTAPSPVSAQVEDLTAPTLTALSFDPPVVNVIGADQTVRLTVHITDDLSGFAFGCFSLRSPSSAQSRAGCFSDPAHRASGTSTDGVYHVDVTIPRFSETGEWHVLYMSLTDVVSNNRVYTEAGLIDAGLGATFEVVSAPDSSPPSLTDLSFIPAAIDVSGGAQTARLVLRIADDSAGFSFGCFTLRSPLNLQTRSSCFGPLDGGTNLDGWYHSDVFFPQFSESGDWRFQYLSLTDTVGNNRVLLDQDLTGAGFAAVLHVDSVPADLSTPSLAAFEMTPAGLDTSTGPQTMTLSMHVTDNLAGFAFGCFTVRSPSFAQSHSGCFSDPWQRRSGTALDGVYVSDVFFPQFSEIGDWHILYLSLTDAVGNNIVLFEQNLIDAGFRTTVTVTQDSTPPALTVSLSPDVLWPPNHKLVSIAATVTSADDQGPAPAVELVSIVSSEPDEGVGDGDITGDIQDAALGTDDRTFRLRAERAGSGPGRVYTVTYRATDAAGNTSTASATVTVPHNR